MSSVEEAPTCAICKEELASGPSAVSLPCAHTFHSDCIDRWLEVGENCPTCRGPVKGGSQHDAFQNDAGFERDSEQTVLEEYFAPRDFFQPSVTTRSVMPPRLFERRMRLDSDSDSDIRPRRPWPTLPRLTQRCEPQHWTPIEDEVEEWQMTSEDSVSSCEQFCHHCGEQVITPQNSLSIMEQALREAQRLVDQVRSTFL